MALVLNKDRDTSGFIGVASQPLEIELPDVPEARPTFFRELIPAGFQQESPLSGLFRPSAPKADFINGKILENPWENTEGTVFEMYPDSLIDVFTQEQKDFREQEILRELENEETLEAGGFLGFLARFAGAAADPIILIPVGGAATVSAKLGANFLKGAVKTGTAAFLGISASEAALQYQQQTRTFGQSITNISVGTLLSATLGGSLSALTGAQRRALRVETKRAMNPEVAGGALGPNEVTIPQGAFDADIASTKVLATTNTEIALEKGLGVESLADLINLNRGIRLMSKSQFQAMKELTSETFEVPFQTTGQAYSALETQLVGEIEAFNLENVLSHRSNFIKYRQRVAREKGKRLLPLPDRARAALEDTKGFYREKRGIHTEGFLEDLNRRQFNETISRVEFLADDIDAFARESPEIPSEVIAQAKINRGIRDQIKEMGIETGLWDEGVKVKNADGYLNIVYKQDFIERGEFPDGVPARTRLRQELLEQRRKDQLEGKVVRFDEAEPDFGKPQGLFTTPLTENIEESPFAGQFENAKQFLFKTQAKKPLDVTGPDLRVEIPSAPGRSVSGKGKITVSASIKALRKLLGPDDFDELIALPKEELMGRLRRDFPDVDFKRSFDTVEALEAAAGKLARNKKFDAIIDRSPDDPSFSEFIALEKSALKRTRLLSEAELEDSVDSSIEKIIGAPAGRILYEEDVLPRRAALILDPAAPKATKARKLNLPQDVLFKYSEQDSEFLLHRYVQSLLPDIRLMQQFGGWEGLRTRINAVRAEARIKINAAKTGAEKAKFQKMLNSNIKDYTDGIDLLRGVYNVEARSTTPARVGRLARNLNSLSFAGTFARSSMPDVGLVVMGRGVRSTIGDLIVPFLKDMENFKHAKADLRAWGIGADLETNSRAANLFEIGDPYGRLTTIERVPQALTGNMLLISLLSPWNAFWKTAAGVKAMNGLFRDVAKVAGGKANATVMKRLKLMGIGPDDAIRIHEQWVKHGVTDRGFKLSNWMEWDESAAREVVLLKNAVRKEVNLQIIEPRILDVPSWIDKETGKMIGQFRRFSFTATNRIALLGGQRLRGGELAVLNGAAISATLGAMISAWADISARGEIQDRTPLQWAIEGLDRSGVTGTFFDINNPLEKVNLGIRNVIGGPTASRYQTRNIASSFLGPTFGRFQTVGQLAGTFGGSITGDAEFTQSDTKALRRMMWYQNVLWADSLVDRIEEGFNDALGIPERGRRRR